MAEVIAFTGQQGSKGLRQRILEVIGAVREWLRNTGFVKLAKLTTSDIAALARKAREYYFGTSEPVKAMVCLRSPCVAQVFAQTTAMTACTAPL